MNESPENTKSPPVLNRVLSKGIVNLEVTLECLICHTPLNSKGVILSVPNLILECHPFSPLIAILYIMPIYCSGGRISALTILMTAADTRNLAMLYFVFHPNTTNFKQGADSESNLVETTKSLIRHQTPSRRQRHIQEEQCLYPFDLFAEKSLPGE